MPEPCKFSSLNSCQKSFLQTPNEIDLAPQLVIGLVLQVGDAEKFPKVLAFKKMDPLLRVSKQGPSFTAIELYKSLVISIFLYGWYMINSL